MKVFKCDKCGKCFANDTTDNLVMTGHENLNNDDIDIGNEYHLCPDCMENFNKWIENPEYDLKEGLDWVWEYIDNYLSNNNVRIGQFLSNFKSHLKKLDVDMYYISDDEFREYLVTYCRTCVNGKE